MCTIHAFCSLAPFKLYASADLSVGSRHFDAVVQTQKYLLSSNSLALVQRYLLNRENLAYIALVCSNCNRAPPSVGWLT